MGKNGICLVFQRVFTLTLYHMPDGLCNSQTRRPTNWATPGYEVKENCSLWSNMWSREFYHSFEELSTEVIRGICEAKGEYPTFGAIEPIWCSSSQTRRPTNWATPGNIEVYYTRSGVKKQSENERNRKQSYDRLTLVENSLKPWECEKQEDPRQAFLTSRNRVHIIILWGTSKNSPFAI